jgi:H+/Cl- antiporter ClcA
VLTLLALLSGGLSLNDGSLSLAAELQGEPGGTAATLLWRYLASLLSIAAGSPGGLMHDSMSLGSLLAAPLRFLPPEAQAQLAAIGATALFAAANRTPLFCALFVFTLQGDPQLVLPLLLASSISAALAEPLRGITWNEAQVDTSLALVQRRP